jgi:hyperosmotically inducible periplasmic protein
MNISTWLVLATFGGVVIAGSAACTQKAADEATSGIATTVDTLKSDGDRALDATKEGAAAVIDGTQKAVSETGDAVADGWITTKVHATFVGETLLKGSDINVDTANHVVTLKGTVGSDAAKARAATIAGGTEGVTRVVNQLVVT